MFGSIASFLLWFVCIFFADFSCSKHFELFVTIKILSQTCGNPKAKNITFSLFWKRGMLHLRQNAHFCASKKMLTADTFLQLQLPLTFLSNVQKKHSGQFCDALQLSWLLATNQPFFVAFPLQRSKRRSSSRTARDGLTVSNQHTTNDAPKKQSQLWPLLPKISFYPSGNFFFCSSGAENPNLAWQLMFG